MGKLTYYVACSVDGFIAHQDGSLDGFLMEGEHITDLANMYPETFPAQFRDLLGIRGENKCFDTVLMGRKTYEVGLQMGITNPYPQMEQYLFSQTMAISPDTNVRLISADAANFVRNLKNNTGKDIWLCGGGNLATTMLRTQLIDELILKVNPFVMGSGIPLFTDTVKPTTLELTHSHTYTNGVVRSHYCLQK